MRLIENVWFKKHRAKYLLVPLLLPLTVLFYLLSTLRRLAFNFGISKSHKLSKPVIIVGNIGVGGNGKTPIVIHLVNLVRDLGLKPGVISRGYGGKAESYPYLLNGKSTAIEAGDEPILIYQRCKVPVAVGSDRVATGQLLIEQGCDVIISDDGLQHYRLQRDIELIIVDGNRLFGNDLLLPAGPLREGQWRLKHSDLVIYNGKAKDENCIATDKSEAVNSLTMELAASHICHLQTGKVLPISEFIAQNPKVNAIAGIGDPQRFFTSLKKLNFSIAKQQGFVDHHSFCLEDFKNYDDNTPLLMTEKDAVKCQNFAQLHWWYVPVSAQFNVDDLRKLQDTIKGCVGSQ